MITLRLDVARQFDDRALTERHKSKNAISAEKTIGTIKSVFFKIAKKSVKLYPFIRIPLVIFLGPILESSVDLIDCSWSMGKAVHHYRSFTKYRKVLDESQLDDTLKGYAIDKINMERRLLRTKLLEKLSEWGVSLSTLVTTIAIIASAPFGPGAVATIGIIASVAGLTFLAIKLGTALYYRPHTVAKTLRLTTVKMGMQSAKLWFRKKIMEWNRKKLLKKYDNDLNKCTDIELEKLCNRQTAIVMAKSKIKSLKEEMRVAAVKDFDFLKKRNQLDSGLEDYIENFEAHTLDENSQKSLVRFFKISPERLSEPDGNAYARKKIKEWFGKEDVGICKRLSESERLYQNAVVA